MPPFGGRKKTPGFLQGVVGTESEWFVEKQYAIDLAPDFFRADFLGIRQIQSSGVWSLTALACSINADMLAPYSSELS